MATYQFVSASSDCLSRMLIRRLRPIRYVIRRFKTYCVSIAARPADETYSSFILYSNTRNTYFGLADTVVTEGDSCSTNQLSEIADAVPVAPVWLLVMMGMAIAGFGWRKLQAA